MYGKVSDELKDDPTNKEPLAEKKRLGNEMQAMQKKYRVTFEALREKMIYLQKRDGLQSVFALTRAEAIWQGMEKILYHGARSSTSPQGGGSRLSEQSRCAEQSRRKSRTDESSFLLAALADSPMSNQTSGRPTNFAL